MDNEYLQEKKAKRRKILGYIFLTWFICSFIGFFILENGYYLVMNFGQYFLVFGLIVLFNSKRFEKFISLSLILVGLGCIVIPYCMLHPELIPTNVNWEHVIVLFSISGLIIASIAAIFIPLFKRKHKKEVCTYEVNATIVDYDTKITDEGNTLYAPIYGYWYNGRDWRVCNNCYSDVDVPEKGKTYTIKINPDNPVEYFNEKSRSYLIVVFVGVFVLIFMLLVLYIFLSPGLAE